MPNEFEMDRFDNCPTKKWLQDNIYTYVGNRMKSNVMMVGGPSVKRQITNVFKIASTPKARVYLVEDDVKRFTEMSRRCQALKNKETLGGWPKDWYDRVIRLHTNIAGYETTAGLDKPVRFEDLDMCQTMGSIQYLVGHRLLLQSKLQGNFRKCMLVTSSLRKHELAETVFTIMRLVSDILGTTATIWPNASGQKHSGRYKGSGVKTYAPYISKHGRLLRDGLQFFSYADKSPMFSCMILYV